MFKLNRNLKILFFVNLATSLSRGLFLPLFPLFLNGLGATVSEIGLVLFVGGVAATALLIPSGILSDRYRRRNILLLSAIMSGLAAFYLATIRSWEQSIFGIMLFSGSMSVFLPTRHSMIADNADLGRMAATYSVMNIVWPTGSIIGPTLGGFLADSYGWTCTFYIAALFSVLSLVPALFFRKTCKGDKKLDKQRVKSSVYKRQFIMFLATVLLFQIFGTTAMGIIDPVVPLYLTQTFNVSTTAVGFFFSMGSGVAILLAQLTSGVLADKYGYRRILLYSVLSLPIISLLWPFIPNYLFVTVLYMVLGGLWSMTWPCALALLVAITPTLKRGVVISARQVAVKLGLTMGPLIGAYVWTAYGKTAPFYVSAIFFTVSLLFIFLLKNNHSQIRGGRE